MAGLIGVLVAALVGIGLAIVAGFGLVSLAHSNQDPIQAPLVVYGSR
jgi:hypothetical protein